MKHEEYREQFLKENDLVDILTKTEIEYTKTH